MSKIDELQENIVDDILSLFYNNKENISIKAPTGSGKTFMMAMLMNRLLSQSDNYIFIVSSLSKGDLAKQCYDSFVKNSEYKFTNLMPYLISTGDENKKNTEYSIQISFGYNVYVLPTNQYTKSSRISKESAFISFLQECKNQNKKLILIKDESHIATNNLNSLKEHFKTTIEFSATPKDDKYDVILKEDEAIRVKLIKSVEYIDNANDDFEADLTKALQNFKSNIKPLYEKHDIVPAFIVQISNMQQGEEEFKKIVKVVEQQGLQWVSFVDSDKKYETNNALTKTKNKKIWRELIKQANYPVEVIIFKMVITEGFDIPRACVLYQVRNTQSKILDEQVIGRVRRNPYLLNFIKLDEKTKEHFSKALVYGVAPDEKILKGKKELKLRGSDIFNQIVNEFSPFKTVTLKEVATSDIDISSCIAYEPTTKDIFQAYRELEKCDSEVNKKRYEFVKSSKDWFNFTNNLDKIKEEVKKVVEDYDKYGLVIEITKGLREHIYTFMDIQGKDFNCENSIWTDNEDDTFYFDSFAELEWFKILNRLKTKCCKSITIDDENVYLFGKNYLDKHTNIKFDYYHKAKHTSYPDFIFKDKKDVIHIFEVKSVNGNANVEFDTQRYKEKVEKLKKAYLYASKKTHYVFYIPIYYNNDWQIWSCENGSEKDLMNKAIFEEYLKGRN